MGNDSEKISRFGQEELPQFHHMFDPQFGDKMHLVYAEPGQRNKLKAKDELVLLLFLQAGCHEPKPGDIRHKARPFFRYCLSSAGRYGFSYRAEDAPSEDAVFLWVPEWAVCLAHSEDSLLWRTQHGAEEKGRLMGVRIGKGFVQQLGKGEMSVNEFENKKDW